MESFINFNESKEAMKVTIDGKDHLVRLAGTTDDPYFNGKDVCMVLGYTDPKRAIRKYVDVGNKTSLGELIDGSINELGTKVVPNSLATTNGTINDRGSKMELLLNSTTNGTIVRLGPSDPSAKHHDRMAIYINEPGLYELILRSKAKCAKAFQQLVCKTILPSIRKYGHYQVNTRLEEAMALLTIKDQEILTKDQEILTKDQEILTKDQEIENARQKAIGDAKKRERLERKVKLMAQLTDSTTPRTKDQFIYVVSTKALSKDNKYKVGGSTNIKTLKSRLRSYQTGTSIDDPYVLVMVERCNNFETMESIIKGLLYGFLEVKTKELYIIHLSWLKWTIENAVRGNCGLIDSVNEKMAKMMEDTIDLEPEPLVEAATDTITLTTNGLTHTQVGRTRRVTTVSLSEEEIKGLILTILNNHDDEVITRKDIENSLMDHNVRIERRKRELWSRVKELGSRMSGKTFKY